MQVPPARAPPGRPFQTFGRTTRRVEYPYHPPLGRGSTGLRPLALPRSLNVRGGRGYHAVEDLGAARRSEGVLRFIVGILWLVLIVFIILVFLNTPGIR